MAGLVVLGLGFTWAARLHLGPLWSSTSAPTEDHRIVGSDGTSDVRLDFAHSTQVLPRTDIMRHGFESHSRPVRPDPTLSRFVHGEHAGNDVYLTEHGQVSGEERVIKRRSRPDVPVGRLLEPVLD